MARKDKIAVFGGTFNPPHNGHVHLLEAFRREIAFDKVLVVPTAQPPHKQVKNLVSGAHRLEMCRRAFADCEICDYEIRRGGKNYTADTLEYLKGIYPNSVFYFIMGTDMLLSFRSWKDPERILQNAVLLCEGRDHETDAAALRSFAKNELHLQPAQFIISDAVPLPISSTEIRQKIKSGSSIAALVPQEVEEYIGKEGLYA